MSACQCFSLLFGYPESMLPSFACCAIGQSSVKQCITPPARFGLFLPHDLDGIALGLAGMDDERFVGRNGGSDPDELTLLLN
jgi:hypothetical protein